MVIIMNETLAILMGLIALFAVLVPLARALAGDGYGVRPPPRRAGQSGPDLPMPHDEPRVTR